MLVSNDYDLVCELGPGTGMLTRALLKDERIKKLTLVEIDNESVEYLETNFNDDRLTIIEADFLKMVVRNISETAFALIGNFPYNISSQIFFRVIENRNLIPEVVCMIQKEVAERIASPPGNKTYGILSVFLQAWFDIEYCFTVNENVFIPPPKVKSAVIRLTRNETQKLDCDEKLFFRVVKTAFNQRRKTLRNALKTILAEENKSHPLLDLRAERLDVSRFVELTLMIQSTGS